MVCRAKGSPSCAAFPGASGRPGNRRADGTLSRAPGLLLIRRPPPRRQAATARARAASLAHPADPIPFERGARPDSSRAPQSPGHASRSRKPQPGATPSATGIPGGSVSFTPDPPGSTRRHVGSTALRRRQQQARPEVRENAPEARPVMTQPGRLLPKTRVLRNHRNPPRRSLTTERLHRHLHPVAVLAKRLPSGRRATPVPAAIRV